MAALDFANRPYRKLILFDVDETLTPARRGASPEMLQMLRDLRKKVAIGFVGGSNLPKITEQLNVHGFDALAEFDFGFAENGLTAYRLGKALPSQSFISFIGEDRYKTLVNFILHYIADMDIPIKRGTFVEFRNGMVNVSPIGRNATFVLSFVARSSIETGIAFENGWILKKYDKEHGHRVEFVKVLREKFADYGLTFSIGGQISFDIFPNGWDKTYCLRHVEGEGFEEIHFFGDKCFKGGNDYEIFSDSRTIGHSVLNPEDTIRILKENFVLGL